MNRFFMWRESFLGLPDKISNIVQFILPTVYGYTEVLL